MTVRELIAKLIEFDMDLEVGMYNDTIDAGYHQEVTCVEEEEVEFPCEDRQRAVICS